MNFSRKLDAAIKQWDSYLEPGGVLEQRLAAELAQLPEQAAVAAYKGLDKPTAGAERAVVETLIQSRELRKQASEEGIGIKNH